MIMSILLTIIQFILAYLCASVLLQIFETIMYPIHNMFTSKHHHFVKNFAATQEEFIQKAFKGTSFNNLNNIKPYLVFLAISLFDNNVSFGLSILFTSLILAICDFMYNMQIQRKIHKLN